MNILNAVFHSNGNTDLHQYFDEVQFFFNYIFIFQPMLDYATKLQTETGGLQFPLQGGQVFRTLCDVYAQFKVRRIFK